MIPRQAEYQSLANAAFTYPAIDNHTHPFLKASRLSAIPFETLCSEAVGKASEDSRHTLTSYRAVSQLAPLLGLNPEEATWDDIKKKRNELAYDELCKTFIKPTGIQCLLIDDGLPGVAENAEEYQWHDQFTSSHTRRIVRLETVAQDILKVLVDASISSATDSPDLLLETFTAKFIASISSSATDPEVAGFKSVACYRTGLDIESSCESKALQDSLVAAVEDYNAKGTMRLAQKTFNDYIVCIVLGIAGKHNKPVQFHTGLGDNDITLSKSSPAFMQPVIKAYPETTFVLLHSSYPYTRDAGYLTAVYRNVVLDFGEVWCFLSGEGQRAVVRQVLELSPTNKIMWSTDAAWWPESYYLAATRSREVIYEVLAESVRRHELTEQQATSIVQKALFENANRIYNLGLKPDTSILA